MSSAVAFAGSVASADTAPTADDVRQEFHDLTPVVLLGFSVLCLTNIAILLVLIGKK